MVIASLLLYFTGWIFYYFGVTNPLIILLLTIPPCSAFIFLAIDRKNIFQVARKGDNVIYAFTYANIENMKSFMRLAFINGTSLNGQVALIDANGQTLTFAEEVKHQDAGLSKIFRNFSGNRLGSYLAVIAVVVCGTLIMMWYSKRRK